MVLVMLKLKSNDSGVLKPDIKVCVCGGGGGGGGVIPGSGIALLTILLWNAYPLRDRGSTDSLTLVVPLDTGGIRGLPGNRVDWSDTIGPL